MATLIHLKMNLKRKICSGHEPVSPEDFEATILKICSRVRGRHTTCILCLRAWAAMT